MITTIKTFLASRERKFYQAKLQVAFVVLFHSIHICEHKTLNFCGNIVNLFLGKPQFCSPYP